MDSVSSQSNSATPPKLGFLDQLTPYVPAPLPNEEIKKINFFDLTMEDLKSHIQSFGKEKYRAQQLYQWVYQKNVDSFDLMTNLSKDFRTELPNIFEFRRPELVSHLKSAIDGTQKFLFKIQDGLTFESVLIPSKDRLTLCVSSEVGCNMACKFCFTAKQKLQKRLSAGDIVSQFQIVNEKIAPLKITNIVFMGMGEPLDNPVAVFNSIKILNSEWGLNFSRKRVTISTSGIVPGLKNIAESGARLAVSLNATTNTLRDDIMPINRKYPLETLMQGCKEYYEIAKDGITFEYVLLKDVNDTFEDAQRIKKLTAGIPCKINLIPFNEHPGSTFKRPSSQKVFEFQDALMKMGLQVLIRRTMGRDIYAACGQLRSVYEGKPTHMTKEIMTTPELTQLG